MTSGFLSIADMDSGESHFTRETIEGQHGTLTIGADGDWTYTAENDQPVIQSLGEGDVLTERFEIQSVDGTGHDISVTVHGSNDAPTLETDKLSITEKEDSPVRFTEADLLSAAADKEGDTLSIHNVRYDGSDGTLSEVNSMVFGASKQSRIELSEKLDSYDAFSIEFEYTSTGSHSGSIDTILSAPTPSQDNMLNLYIDNSDGSLIMDIGQSRVSFDGINLYDNDTHTVVVTWDADNGQITVFDNGEQVTSAAKL